MSDSSECVDHLELCGRKCEDCGLDVDAYGNTEAQFDYCCFPDCGCDGARLCTIGKPSERALDGNVEGMWNSNTPEAKEARTGLVIDLHARALVARALNDKDVRDGS